MADPKIQNSQTVDEEALETGEWIESLEAVFKRSGPLRVLHLLEALNRRALKAGVVPPSGANTPYVTTIPAEKQPPFPGDGKLEWRIRSLIRWNAMAMVVRANRASPGIGGHISTYASAATLLEIGFNHFFRGADGDSPDIVYFQGHASPGIYARAFLEGRLTKEQLENFRRELEPGGGLSSYPHPQLMPDFWQFPTVSMGLSPLSAVYQARFNRYLEDRGLKTRNDANVWAFLGYGEMDEPEAMGGITLASRERLDNLIFVVNCNLQRLDGPVRGNGKIIQELEAIFRGAGWNVIKLIWGSDWDPLLARDTDGALAKRMGEVVDGQYQKYSVESGAYTRGHFFGVDDRLKKMAENLTDEQIRKMRRGGHDPEKVYAAFKAAVENRGSPTIILAKTIKGYGLGEAGEGKNITHQQKKLNEEELKIFRDRFQIPVSDKEVAEAPFYRPPEESPEIQYLLGRRKALGGFVPKRHVPNKKVKAPPEALFTEFHEGTGDREVSTTMVFVKILSKLLRDKEWGKLVVPIVPDEARTFGMESLFRQCGIYSHVGQLYEPVDSQSLLYYREAKDGQILEEGITEAGSMASFAAAASAYATHGVRSLPFFIFYSMFGFQRIGDLVWAATDQRCRGFLIGATSGRTTLMGEGLQHQDGQSHLIASAYPSIRAYDPAFAFELAVIIREGIRRMYEEGEDLIYYLTVGNQNYSMPKMPGAGKGEVKEGILKGLYKFRSSSMKKQTLKANLFGSGAIMTEVLKAAEVLEGKYLVSCDIWSLTSFKALHDDGCAVERWNRLNSDNPPRISCVGECLKKAKGVFVVASDYVKALPDSIARWFPKPPVSLGTDGWGLSESREALRGHFEVDRRHIVLAVLWALAREKKIKPAVVKKTMKEMKIDGIQTS
ncbi:MAG: pyruvate dehydrogenase (acetyl-transferring), homodimeric type [Deltaproteobacteria bacterium]|nr:pyruvate dehydrogenase (acetyl-transferring), homodimeric type [Deltaproteobacteria bacterium]